MRNLWWWDCRGPRSEGEGATRTQSSKSVELSVLPQWIEDPSIHCDTANWTRGPFNNDPIITRQKLMQPVYICAVLIQLIRDLISLSRGLFSCQFWGSDCHILSSRARSLAILFFCFFSEENSVVILSYNTQSSSHSYINDYKSLQIITNHYKSL